MLDRSLAPPFVKSTSFNLPEVPGVQLTNGIKLFHFDEIQQDIVKLEVVYNAGKWFESLPELAYFTTQMLDKGTESRTASQIAEFFDRYGAHIELSSNFDFVSVSLYTLTDHVKHLLPVFVELLTGSIFPSDELALLKEQFIQSLRVKNEKTSYLASKLIRRSLFGSAHPYGHTANEEEVENIQQENIVSYFNSRFKPTHVFILGPMHKADYRWVTTAFSQFENGDTSDVHHDKAEESSKIIFSEKSNSVQSSIRLGKVTLRREHPDYPGLVLLNYYLGGFFGSRLMKNLREAKGLTYGISSSVNPFHRSSALLIGTDINKENKDLAIDEILKEIKLLQTYINAEELDSAKRHFIGSLQSEIASPFSVLGKLKTITLHQLPNHYYQNLIRKIDTATREELFSLASKYLSESSFYQVTVG